ncbi:hypothetical protein [Roseibacillus persicicus]|nr:hypothetical protein [Roseibacillus persicicus]
MSFVSAALVVTVSPGENGGTRFHIEQISPNPPFFLNQVTVGYRLGILLPEASLFQTESFAGESATFSPTLGTLTDVRNGESREISGLQFQQLTPGGLWSATLALDSPLIFDSGESHLLKLTEPRASETSEISFSRFRPGQTTYLDVAWGEVTTVVIPEPTGSTLLMLSTMIALGRRHRSQVRS